MKSLKKHLRFQKNVLHKIYGNIRERKKILKQMKRRLESYKKYKPRNFIRTALQLEDISYLENEIWKHEQRLARLYGWKNKKQKRVRKLEKKIWIRTITQYEENNQHPVICIDKILARYDEELAAA
jgi:ABC-type enterochelin transport system substrate-binding protein